MQRLCDDALVVIFRWVARVDATTAVVAVPLVGRRWKHVLETLCTSANLTHYRANRITCSLPVAMKRLRSVWGLSIRSFLRIPPPEHIHWIGVGCPTLTRLKLSNIYTTELPGLVSMFPPLTHLSVFHSLIADDDLAVVAKRCPGLVHLGVSCCARVTDAGLAALVGEGVALTYLDLTNTRVTDAGLTAVASGCPALARLNISRWGRSSCSSAGRLFSLTAPPPSSLGLACFFYAARAITNGW